LRFVASPMKMNFEDRDFQLFEVSFTDAYKAAALVKQWGSYRPAARLLDTGVFGKSVFGNIFGGNKGSGFGEGT